VRSPIHVAFASMVKIESFSEVSSANDPFTVIHNNDEKEKSINVVKLNGANYLA